MQIVWFDDRAEWLERGPVSSPRLKKMHVVAPEELHREIERLAEESFILSLTKGHASDLQVLRSVIKRKFPYIGVIGSKTKGLSLRRQLIEEGFDAASAERFFCPVGEPFGSNQPEEIAFSIIAQVLKVRDHFRHPPLDPQ